MGRKLASTVVLWDAETQSPRVLEAGTEPSAEDAKLIDNPKAWGKSAAPADGDDGDDADDDGRPAQSAKKAEWVDYAESLGVELDDDATKQDYIDAVDAL
jgi:hypothetical protein